MGEAGVRRAAAFLAAILLADAAGCAPYPIEPAVPKAPAQRPAPARPNAKRQPQAPAPAPAPTPTPAPPEPSAPRSPIPPSRTSGADQCGAAELQGLVGRPRSEIPIPIYPNLQRVACTTCPVSDDVNPARLNFFFDANTGLIKQVRCG